MEERRMPRAGEFYRHFKNKLYQIVAIAKHSETGEKMVVYQALYGDFSTYVRPLSMFLSETDHEKYPQAMQKYRFERVEFSDEETEKEKGSEENVPESRKADIAIEPDEPGGQKQELAPQELLMEFLDAGTYTEKLNILRGMKKKIDDKMVQDMAASLDIVVAKKPLEEQIYDLEGCLKTCARFECGRLR